MFKHEHINLLKEILDKSCTHDNIIKCSDLFELFEREANSTVEFYKFRKYLSSLIKDGVIHGYEIKTGRCGGVKKISTVEFVQLNCSFGQFNGVVPNSKLTDFIKSMTRSS